MKAWRLLAALVMLGGARGIARADGMLVAPSHMLAFFSEQAQVAVIEVKPDRTVAVDLFVSLLDTSGQSHEVHFLLPLQTMPAEFRVEELTLATFQERLVRPLEELFQRAAEARRNREQTLTRLYTASSLLSGPCAFAVDWAWTGWPGSGLGRAASGGPITPPPALSVQTEHSQVDVYRALNKDELAALAKMRELPESVRKALTSYVGKPFALLRLRTQPGPARTEQKSWARPDEHPGIHLKFSQDMVMTGYEYYNYAYPLGTGQGWDQPIPLTQVYISGPDDLPLEVYFPQRHTTTDLRSKRPARITEEALGYAADGRQVHVATYLESNPREDVRIGLRGEGQSEFAIQQRRLKREVLLAWIGFPLLGIFAWAVAFSAAVWHSEAAKQLGLWRAFWQSWLMLQILLLLPLLALAALWNWTQYAYFDIDPTSLFFSLIGGSNGLHDVLLVTEILLGLATMAGILHAAARRGPCKWRPLVWRSTLAAVLAAVIYLFTGSLWLFRLLA